MPTPNYDISDEQRALLTLTFAPKLGPIRIARLLDFFGSASRVVDSGRAALSQVEGIGRVLSQDIHDAIRQTRVDEEVERAARAGASFVFITDSAYPNLLRLIQDPPPVLYVRGEIDRARDALTVALVGSRRCSAYGREQAGRFAAGLAQSGFTIVSGGARGIDTQAHRGALRAEGRTIVVLGCGMSHVYPEENADLFDEIANGKRGAIVSEFPMMAAPIAENFPRRNRIISGLSLGTVVIEASTRSGALITARLACEDHNREVMALPGRVDAENSAGCLRMLREGWARLVTSPADVMEGLEESRHLLARDPQGALFGGDEIPDWRRPPAQAPAATSDTNDVSSIAELGLTESQQRILREFDGSNGETTLEMDDLAARTGLDISRLQSDVTMLQIRGLVQRTPSAGVERRQRPGQDQ